MLRELPVELQVGDLITFASSSLDRTQLERSTVVSVTNGTIVSLSDPLNYTHFGEILSFPNPRGGPSTIDERTEVGVLSRNVRLSGGDSAASGSGAYIFVEANASAAISNIFCQYCGQASSFSAEKA